MPEFSEGDVVEHEGETGVVAGVITFETEWVFEEDGEEKEYEINGSEENPVYIVALEEETVPVEESEISSSEWDDEEPDADDVEKELTDAELSDVYFMTDHTDDFELFEEALNEYRETSELQNIPGAKDPHVGFASLPNGWDRTSVLKAWSTFRGQWRICYPRMVRHFGPRMAKRWCSALKDEVLQTTHWRNRY